MEGENALRCCRLGSVPARAMEEAKETLESQGGSRSIRIPVGNGNGDKLRRIPSKRRRVEKRLATLDTDGDGIIDREELVRAACMSDI